MATIRDLISEDTPRYWEKLRIRMKEKSPEELRALVQHYEEVQNYAIFFRVPVHIVEITCGRGITPTEYIVAQEILEDRRQDVPSYS